MLYRTVLPSNYSGSRLNGTNIRDRGIVLLDGVCHMMDSRLWLI